VADAGKHFDDDDELCTDGASGDSKLDGDGDSEETVGSTVLVGSVTGDPESVASIELGDADGVTVGTSVTGPAGGGNGDKVSPVCGVVDDERLVSGVGAGDEVEGFVVPDVATALEVVGRGTVPAWVDVGLDGGVGFGIGVCVGWFEAIGVGLRVGVGVGLRVGVGVEVGV